MHTFDFSASLFVQAPFELQPVPARSLSAVRGYLLFRLMLAKSCLYLLQLLPAAFLSRFLSLLPAYDEAKVRKELVGQQYDDRRPNEMESVAVASGKPLSLYSTPDIASCF
ncbi:hypothetical protein D9M70_621140 [compost metagenome]